MKKPTKHMLLLLLLSSLMAEAQNTNMGELYLVEGTELSSIQDFNNEPTGTFINDGDASFYSNLTNNGVLDHFGDNGISRFISNSTQNIGGSEFCFFNNIVFNNTTTGLNDISLNTTISIANEANFTNGIVNSESILGDIIFERNALAFNVSDDSFVDGLAHKEGDTDFDFPIGDSEYYRPASISAPIASSSEFNAKYFFENPNANYPLASRTGVIERVNDSEYWLIENTSGDENVFITLSWNRKTTPAVITASPTSAIHVVRWDEGHQLWVDEGGIIDKVNNTITTRVALTDYGIFTLGRVFEELILPGDRVVYNAVTANNDGMNDVFLIDNIDEYVNNEVEIFNRWGQRVFKTKGYGTNGNVFRGESSTTSNGFLPSGTYFYVISYDYIKNDSVERTEKAGYLYLNTE